MFSGQAVSLTKRENGIAELVFDNQQASVNVLNALTQSELKQSVELLEQHDDIRGLLIRSAKDSFIVGADITEFGEIFSQENQQIKNYVNQADQIFVRLENLPFPTVAVINGLALGGGFELALAADYRVLAKGAQVGLPEVNLGICPAWGGMVRMTRLLGHVKALECILDGKPLKTEVALECGLVDSVADDAECTGLAEDVLISAMTGTLNWKDRRAQKVARMPDLNDSVHEQLNGFKKKFNTNYPAYEAIYRTILQFRSLTTEQALDLETDCLIELAKGDTSKALIGFFLNEQVIKRQAKKWSKSATPIDKAAVIGAGIMGGGIAYQSALTGTPIVMKDIAKSALDLGLKTAAKLLDKQVQKGKLTASKKQQVMDSIEPTLGYEQLNEVNVVIEAVVENEAIKKSVLSEIEDKVNTSTVLTSNTSTLSIDALAQGLKRPEQFCGLHFFNPVHLMPLVEVIRGKKSSDETIATSVAYALSLKKTPIVVNDCPGFLVNRILIPYFNAFNLLLNEGVDFERIDMAMEDFGWPMGPAYLADVVGIDTLVHADRVMQEGFPDRMQHQGELIVESMLEANYLGQKNGLGFYEYGVDASGQRYKKPHAEAQKLIHARAHSSDEIEDQQIVERMMIPMCLEAVRCLDDQIVETPAEVDMGLLYGLGFPRFRGGAIRYIDTIGLSDFVAQAKCYEDLSALYVIPESLLLKLRTGEHYYS